MEQAPSPPPPQLPPHTAHRPLVALLLHNIQQSSIGHKLQHSHSCPGDPHSSEAWRAQSSKAQAEIVTVQRPAVPSSLNLLMDLAREWLQSRHPLVLAWLVAPGSGGCPCRDQDSPPVVPSPGHLYKILREGVSVVGGDNLASLDETAKRAAARDAPLSEGEARVPLRLRPCRLASACRTSSNGLAWRRGRQRFDNRTRRTARTITVGSWPTTLVGKARPGTM